MLHDCIVTEFYKQRIGFFVVSAAFAFGILSGREHVNIAQTALTNLPFLGLICSLWTGYTLMVIQWIRHHLSLPEYRFLYALRTIRSGQRMRYFLYTTLQLLAPVLLYGLFIVCIAFQKNILMPVIILVSVIALLIMSTLLLLEWLIRHPAIRSQSVRRKTLNLKRPVSFSYWTLEWLLRERTLTLLITKTASAVLIAGVILYYQTGEYDLRLPALGLTLATLLNTGLSAELFSWQNHTWLWLRSLPVSPQKQIIRILTIHFTILLPEIVITWRYGWGSLQWWEMIQLNLFCLTLILLVHSLFYLLNQTLEEMVRLLFWLFIGLTFIIMYKTSISVVAAIMLVVAGINYKKRSPYSRTPPG